MILILSLLTILNFNSPKLKVENAWLRPAAKGMNSAMYFKIVNNSSKPDTLYKAASSTAELVQIHETFKKNGLMGMREVKFIVIKPHSTLTFKPGGYHVMFIKLKKDFKVKSKEQAELYFKGAGKIDIKAVVKKQ
jgi:hypothetical protein